MMVYGWQLPLYGFVKVGSLLFSLLIFGIAMLMVPWLWRFIDQEKLAANLAGHTLPGKFYSFLERS